MDHRRRVNDLGASGTPLLKAGVWPVDEIRPVDELDQHPFDTRHRVLWHDLTHRHADAPGRQGPMHRNLDSNTDSYRVESQNESRDNVERPY